MKVEILSSLCLAVTAVGAIPVQQYTLKQYPQQFLDKFNNLRYVGNPSPYLENPGYGIDRDVPSTCKVTQANLFARHGERYPTTSLGASITKRLGRFLKGDFQGGGDLQFLQDYDFKALDSSNYEKETTTGPYAGVVDMLKFGADFRNRYRDLVSNDNNTKFYTASSARVVVSAEYFAQGFLGRNYHSSQIIVINETDSQLGANSLTPVEACTNFNTSANDDIVNQLSEKYLDDIADRLNKLSSNANITKQEVSGLFDYCGFDLNVQGFSPICNIFDTSEWVARSYANDVAFYYQGGPGNNVSAAVGSVYVDALINLMKSDDFNLTMSFAHDSDILLIIAALGVYDGDLSTDYIDFDAKFKTSYTVPMGSRLIFERLECDGENYLRFILNDAVIPIPGHSSGPGFSVAIDEFEEYISDHLNGRSYKKTCGIADDVPTNMTLFWDNN